MVHGTAETRTRTTLREMVHGRCPRRLRPRRRRHRRRRRRRRRRVICRGPVATGQSNFHRRGDEP